MNRLAIAAMLLLCMVSTSLFAQSSPDFPTLTGRIIDQANLLDTATASALNEQLAAHEETTSNQIVVVTVDSLDGMADAEYALRLGRQWGIGTEEKSNGVILLVAPNERKVRIEVGYGLEGALPDGLAGQIIRRNILPQFKETDYPGGIRSGVNAILQAVAGEYEAEPAGSRRSSDRKTFDFIPLVFIAMIGLPAILRKKGFYRVANAAFPGGFAGLFATALSGNFIIGILIGLGVFAAIYMFHKNAGGSGDGSGRGYHDRHGRSGGYGGRFGGGGGGFSGGGGGFGGGGASGSW